MLKPKRKLTKREIRRDPLLENLEKGKAYFEQNKQRIYSYTGGVVLILVLLWGWNNNRQSQDEEAMLATTKVMNAYLSGVNEDVIAELEKVVMDYGDRQSAALSLYYLGQTRLDSSDLLGAAEVFEQLRTNTTQSELKIAAILKLAEIAELDLDYSRAARLYSQAAGLAMPRAETNYRLQAAYAHYSAGEYEQCAGLVDEIIDSKPPGKVKEAADYLRGSLQGK